MADFMKLVTVRNAIKTKLTKILNDLKQNAADMTLVELQVTLDDVDKHQSKLDRLQETMFSMLNSEEEINVQIDAGNVVEEVIKECTILIKQSQANIMAKERVDVPVASTSGRIPKSEQTESNVKARLPKLELPDFDGTFEDWISFKDQFKSMITDNSSLSATDKMQYLKSCLKGEAEKLIGHFTISANNFQPAWDLLVRRYGNEREIIFSLIRKLFNLSKVNGGDNVATQLRKLLDSFLQITSQLRVMGRKVGQWDDLLVVTMVDKLDSDTRKEWGKALSGTNMPTAKELEDFLENYVRGIQAFTSNDKNNSKSKERQTEQKSHTVKAREMCHYCPESHPLFRCEKFAALRREDKVKVLKQCKLCFNCLSSGHWTNNCKWKGTCKKCGEKHNTLIHDGERKEKTKTETAGLSGGSNGSISSNFVSGGTVLLSTAIVEVTDSVGSSQKCRVFLDSGSEASFMTEKCATKLGLKRRKCNVSINGVGANGICKANGTVDFKLKSCVTEFELNVCALVLSKVTGELPSFPVGSQWKSWEHLATLKLADPRFYEPREVDILLGADVAEYVFLDQRLIGRRNEPIARSSQLGWIISGPVTNDGSSSVLSSVVTLRVHSARVECEELLQKFWELEQVPDHPNWTAEETEAEKHFLAHTKRENGRYVVSLPMKSNISNLGKSRDTALKRLFAIERKLAKDVQHQRQYRDFMSEYLTLGHMEPVPKEALGETLGKTYYLPHHCVLKEDSATTKLRVVFDGSCKTSSNLSLNDCMMVGPVVQPDLFTHLLRFRMYTVALKSDIKKMYRQFLVSPADRDFQRILWRETTDEPVREFRLKTVTYGTAAAPFLATRLLNQLAEDEGARFPLAAVALRKHFYVDDHHGSFPLESLAADTKLQLEGILSTVGLELSKWASNFQNVIGKEIVSNEMPNLISLTDESQSKALGVQWNSTEDNFSFPSYRCDRQEFSRRHLLKEIARVFDPLGFLAPFTIVGKLIFQQLWAIDRVSGKKMDWDAPIPESILGEWNSYLDGMSKLSVIKIPRLINCECISELHGFSDASEKAYSAVVYLRAFSSSISVRVVAAKTKVAPLKAQSLPRLELCGALLLAKLMNSVISAMDLRSPVHCWTDSEIVLKWISSPSRRFVTFVANRVSEIQQLIPGESFHFIPGIINPADCASRGLPVDELSSFNLWWNGPDFLQCPGIPNFQFEREIERENLEERKVKLVNHNQLVDSILNRYSSAPKLFRVIGYVLRFISNAKDKKEGRQVTKLNFPLLSVEDLDQAMLKCVWLSQRQDFPEEIKRLSRGKMVKVSSRIVSLTPFLDSHGNIRVGGRLGKAEVPDSAKHQLILDGKSAFAKLLVENLHRKLHHGGEMVLRSELQQRFWILRVRNCVKLVLRNCVRCRRVRGIAMKQLMGDLPAARVRPAAAFERTGVDYAGPYTLQSVGGRGRKPFKAYIALFICFVIKAIHLEVVTDLTTEGFLGAFKRFISRRGKPSHMYSDCGTNFVGLDNAIREVISSPELNADIHANLAEDGVEWHFNPPSAPHQGGLWESAVKRVKFHLKTVIGEEVLTLSEFNTILCQIEAVLNSRPLGALSEDPDDMEALTPGHFLVGRSLVALPQPDFQEIRMNRLSRWERQEQITQRFWNRWYKEYLSSLQQRVKWQRPLENVKVGDLVSIVEDNLPPLKWRLGRVIELHPGDDGLVRVVTVKTAKGVYSRPIVKIVPLLHCNTLESDEEDFEEKQLSVQEDVEDESKL